MSGEGWPLSYAEVPVTSALHSTLVHHQALHAQLPVSAVRSSNAASLQLNHSQPLTVPHPHPISHAAAAAAMQAIHAQMPPAHLVAASPALASPVGSASSGATPPCSTLFVANLGQFVSEQELKDLFGRCGPTSRARLYVSN